MRRWMRAAQVNKRLIFIVVLLGIVAGVVWTCRLTGGDEDGVPAVGVSEKFKLWCPGRDEPFMVTKAETEELKEENGLYENPETGVCECSFTEPAEPSDGMVMP